MKNIVINEVLSSNRMLAPRMNTDKLFPLAAGSYDYRGYLDDAIRFIEDFQLNDRPLWSKFVQVFVDRHDGENRGWRGEYWGKMMRGGCITYNYTQSPELLASLTGAVEGLLTTADEDGRISSYPREMEYRGWDVWSRKYVLLGLEHFYEICPDEALKARVLTAACAHADYMLATLGEGKIDITKTTSNWEGVNSSSVLEPIVRLYSLTGEQKYLDFATYIVQRGGGEVENIFETAFENKKKPHEYRITKAYETISCFEGLLEYYRVTGVEKWRTAALNLGYRICESEVSIIGTGGCWHELFDHTKTRQLSTTYTGVQQETCVTVTWMKFCLQLLCLTGDSRFADEIEKSVYNALLGAINHEKSTHHGCMPFDSYSPLIISTRARSTGGKQYFPDGSHYGCCACIGSAGTGLIPLASALLREDGVSLNLYIPGTIATRTPTGAPLEIAVKTDYPADGAISMTLDTTDEAPFTVALRIPAWSRNTTLALNGELIDATPGTYVELTRVWHCDDRIELFFDMRTEVLSPEGELPDEDSPYHVALRRGPLTLARDSRLQGNIHDPVCIETDAEGYATVEPLDTVPFKYFHAFRVKQSDGTWLETVDYASAGHTWDNRSLVSAWMPTRRYGIVDITQPFIIYEAALTGTSSLNAIKDYIRPLSVVDGVVTAGAEHGEIVIATLVDWKNDTCLIKIGEQYLALDEEGRAICAKKGTRFRPEHQGLNRYVFILPEQGRLRFDHHSATQACPITLHKTQNLYYHHVFILRNVEE
ncbi:MAG: hypothetical protein E7624_02165 [Ruminococcaceae bacterium]|nr:hypothetical protein [Oscillospiraceae bacterium]